MFQRSSRYFKLPNLIYTAADGREVVYRARRFCPQGSSLPQRGTQRVRQSDRLDLVAFRAYANPELFWLIADANDAVDPFDLTRDPDRVLRIPERTE